MSLPERPHRGAPPARQSASSQIALIFVARTVLNTAHRIIYPFLPALARGLDLSLAAASGLVTVRFVAGLAAPFIGPWADGQPRRRTMEIGLALLVVAALLLVASNSIALAAVAFALFGLSKVFYDPAVHAYLGELVPYQRRARAIGAVELSWSSAWLIGVPATGLLMDRFNWRSPWLLLAALGVLSLGLTHARLPAVSPPAQRRRSTTAIRSLLHAWRDLLRQRPVIALLLTSMLLSMSMELPFIVYGAWLEDAFGLGLSTLGLASIVVGLAEASAELGTTLLTDRVGKKRSVFLGLLGLTISLLLLPTLADLGLVAALAGVVLVVLSFEFAIVSLLPLVTEMAPGARASLLSLNVTAFSLGRMAGATTGGWLWSWQPEQIAYQAVAGATCALLAAVAVWRGLAEIEGPTSGQE
ncbi:MAG: MFS transporter [Anaerolineae bacterium]|nr:MFS transporter [Anaerolineae bacterium]